MKALRIFVALLILLESSSAGIRTSARLYERPVARTRQPTCFPFSTGDPGRRRAIGKRCCRRRAFPRHHRCRAPSPAAAFYGITQWKGSAGNVRGRLSLPTAAPDCARLPDDVQSTSSPITRRRR